MAATNPIPIYPPSRPDVEAQQLLALRESGHPQAPRKMRFAAAGARTAGRRIPGGAKVRGGALAPNGTAAGGQFR